MFKKSFQDIYFPFKFVLNFTFTVACKLGKIADHHRELLKFDQI
ncbi:hypothetical protein CAMRE0001_0013 [Campylobacter rectus RM3267]|uniref:Uncharacterized protein n=1 Tax=Campylobacter rectus RM3267 TaxID=553218 RepID=B9D3F8_CAMRE|nr:hypothetical protein CAMRE0001_0013 [Campylobacter rectus RM3267]